MLNWNMTANAQTQWTLTEYESATTLETWRINLLSILSLEVAFEPFLRRDVIWGRKTKTNPFRGFSGADAEQQVSALETMLGLIANYAPIVSRGTIVKNSTSLNAIWKVLHLYYGIQSNDDTGQPFHSETPHQSYNPPDQEYAMCKPAEKPDCDFQCLPRDDKPRLKRSKSNRQPDCDLQYQSKDNKAFQLIIEPKMQSRTIDILLSHADDESEPQDDTTPVLIEGSENITPDLLDIISTEQSSSQCIGSLKTVHNSSAKATRSLQLLLERSKSVTQSSTDDSHIFHSDDDSNLEDISMNMDSVPALSDHEKSLPDSTSVTSSKCSVPQILPTESIQSCSSLWKSTVLSPQTSLSSKSSCRSVLKTSNWNIAQSLQLPSTSQKAVSEKTSPDHEGKPATESSQAFPPAHGDTEAHKDTSKQSKSLPQFQSERSLSAAADDLSEKLKSPNLIQDSTLLAPTHDLSTDQSSKISVDLHDEGQITSDTSFIESPWKSSTPVQDDLIPNPADHSLLTSGYIGSYFSDDTHRHPVQPFLQQYLQEESLRDHHPDHSVVVPLSSPELLIYPVDTSSPQRKYSLNTIEDNDAHSAALEELLPSTDTTYAMLNQASSTSKSPTKTGSSDKADSTSKNGIWCTINKLKKSFQQASGATVHCMVATRSPDPSNARMLARQQRPHKQQQQQKRQQSPKPRPLAKRNLPLSCSDLPEPSQHSYKSPSNSRQPHSVRQTHGSEDIQGIQKTLDGHDLEGVLSTKESPHRHSHSLSSHTAHSDVLCISTDRNPRHIGINNTAYIRRRWILPTFCCFNAELPRHCITWPSCEIDVLGIG